MNFIFYVYHCITYQISEIDDINSGILEREDKVYNVSDYTSSINSTFPFIFIFLFVAINYAISCGVELWQKAVLGENNGISIVL